MMQAVPLLLASGSAARRGLLHAAGLRFSVQPPDIDEAALKRRMRGGPAEAAALALAAAKANAAPAPEGVVIGADQILVCEGVWFDKPGDADGVMEHLLRLRGRTHTLVTAVCCWQGGVPLWHHVAAPLLTMRPFSDTFLEAYLAAEGEACTGCVGGYRYEAGGMHLFDRVEGEQAAIVGMPMLALLGFLRSHGVLMA